MQTRIILCNRLGILLATAATAYALTPGLAQSGTLEKFNLSGGGGEAMSRNGRISNWDKFEALDLNNHESTDLAQNIIRNVNPSWSRTAAVNRANLFPGWARPGWGALRPWDQGWYDRRYYTAWSWWGTRSRNWRTTNLASRVSINKAIDDAINSYTPYIVVPKTNYKLLYGTELPSGDESVSFAVQVNSTDYQLNANCKQGTLNGQQPINIEEAELLNAACQVAYGPV